MPGLRLHARVQAMPCRQPAKPVMKITDCSFSLHALRATASVATVALVSGMAIAGCSSGSSNPPDPAPDTGPTPPPGMACTMQAVAGVMVSARDQSTGAPLTEVTGTATASNPDTSGSPTAPPATEVLKPSVTTTGDGTTLNGLWERAGDFTIAVDSPGYATWAQSIRIARDASGCHVKTVQLDAVMVRQ